MTTQAERPPDLDASGKPMTADAAPAQTENGDVGPNTAVTSSLVSHLLPYIQRGIYDFATNPNVAKRGSQVGRMVGAVTSFPAGISGFGDVAKGAWTGGKAGWFTGKLAQEVAQHVSNLASTVEPYLAKLQSGVGATGVTDLAQMAEPDRKDIGVMGVGPSLSDADIMAGLVSKRGIAPLNAAKAVSKGNLQKFNELMKPYLKKS